MARTRPRPRPRTAARTPFADPPAGQAWPRPAGRTVYQVGDQAVDRGVDPAEALTRARSRANRARPPSGRGYSTVGPPRRNRAWRIRPARAGRPVRRQAPAPAGAPAAAPHAAGWSARR